MIKKRFFSIEALESRAMLAGNVTVQQDGDTLTVTGDDLGNEITLIRNNGGQLVVTGVATMVNNGVAAIPYTGINNIVVNSNGGNDTVTIDNNNIALNSVQANLGAGDDILRINKTSIQSLSITGGDGNDTTNLGILFQPNITTVAGQNAAIAAGSLGAVNNLNFDGGNGNDTFVANRVFGDGDWNIALGSGTDTYRTYWTSSGTLNLDAGSGDDSVSIGYHVSNEHTNAQGGDGNDLLSVHSSNFKDDATFGGGSGYDTIAVDTNYFENNITIDGGSDADTIVLAASVIDGHASVIGGGGDDNVRIGRRYDNSLGGNIIREHLHVDLGSGRDTLILAVNDLRSFYGSLGGDDDNATVESNKIQEYGTLDGAGGNNTVTRINGSNLKYYNFNN